MPGLQLVKIFRLQKQKYEIKGAIHTTCYILQAFDNPIETRTETKNNNEVFGQKLITGWGQHPLRTKSKRRKYSPTPKNTTQSSISQTIDEYCGISDEQQRNREEEGGWYHRGERRGDDPNVGDRRRRRRGRKATEGAVFPRASFSFCVFLLLETKT